MQESLRKGLVIISAIIVIMGLFSSSVAECWYWRGQPGVYGKKGVPSKSSVPGARFGAAYWTDQEGNFWLMGGYGHDKGTHNGLLNDVWKYHSRDNTWTWMAGSDTCGQHGVYGIKGVPSQSNVPGARWFAASWTDSLGNFWLMGGTGHSIHNDLWKYNPRDNTWTWMAGSDTCDTNGESSHSNEPGARYEAATWIDAGDNLWLMGGIGHGHINDLWKYSTRDNTWTWVADPPDCIGYLYSAVTWTDSLGNFWLMGGVNRDSMHTSTDLWKYNPRDNTWLWMAGNEEKPHGVYGKKGVPSPSNMPGARCHAATWMDSEDNLWLMGGIGMGGERNDVWKYHSRDNTWTWMAGSDKYNRPGSQDAWIWLGEPEPRARHAAASWTDSKGNFWLMGGYSYTNSDLQYHENNDLWKYNPRTNEWTWVRK